jgi:uncharacterized lipoprotein YmbA
VAVAAAIHIALQEKNDHQDLALAVTIQKTQATRTTGVVVAAIARYLHKQGFISRHSNSVF